MTKIQTFKHEGGSTIIQSWDKLKDYRRKLAAASATARDAYADDALFLILASSLPAEYAPIIDALDIQGGLSADDRVKFLIAKEDRIKEALETKQAYLAKLRKHFSRS